MASMVDLILTLSDGPHKKMAKEDHLLSKPNALTDLRNLINLDRIINEIDIKHKSTLLNIYTKILVLYIHTCQ